MPVDQDHDHYHVVAAQDWGGTQEYMRYWGGSPDRPGRHGVLTERDAKMLIENIVAYDTVSTHLVGTEVFDLVFRELGDDLIDLASSNVAPGWDRIWMVPCGPCCNSGSPIAQVDEGRVGPPVWAGTVGEFNWDGDDEGFDEELF